MAQTTEYHGNSDPDGFHMCCKTWWRLCPFPCWTPLLCSIRGLSSHGPASFVPLLKGSISPFIFSLVKMSHPRLKGKDEPLDVGMYHNPEF